MFGAQHKCLLIQAHATTDVLRQETNRDMLQLQHLKGGLRIAATAARYTDAGRRNAHEAVRRELNAASHVHNFFSCLVNAVKVETSSIDSSGVSP